MFLHEPRLDGITGITPPLARWPDITRHMQTDASLSKSCQEKIWQYVECIGCCWCWTSMGMPFAGWVCSFRKLPLSSISMMYLFFFQNFRQQSCTFLPDLSASLGLSAAFSCRSSHESARGGSRQKSKFGTTMSSRYLNPNSTRKKVESNM